MGMMFGIESKRRRCSAGSDDMPCNRVSMASNDVRPRCSRWQSAQDGTSCSRWVAWCGGPAWHVWHCWSPACEPVQNDGVQCEPLTGTYGRWHASHVDSQIAWGRANGPFEANRLCWKKRISVARSRSQIGATTTQAVATSKANTMSRTRSTPDRRGPCSSPARSGTFSASRFPAALSQFPARV
jgi:hypothetical protein